MGEQSNSPYNKDFIGLGDVYEHFATSMNSEWLKNLVKKTELTGVHEVLPNQSLRYPDDISNELDDTFIIEGAL
jgi:hypothetical protein